MCPERSVISTVRVTTRGIDIDVNFPFRILRFEKQELCNDEICDLIIDWLPKKDDSVFQEARVDIIGPLASVRMFDHSGNEHRLF